MAKLRLYSAMPLPVLFGITFACAITAPTAGASLPQGTPVSITGTLSGAAVTVQVKLGSTVLGSASIVGNTWSFSWTPQVGDVGNQTINVVATSASGAQASDSVSVTVSSADTPLTIFGASVLGWYRGDTVTIGTGVSSWTDKTGNGNHLIQATTGAQPAYTASDATLNNRGTLLGNGTSTFLNCVGMVVPATCWIWIILKQVGWTSASKIVNWPGSGSIIQTATTPGIQASFSNSTPQNDGAPIGSWKRLIARLDNTMADSLTVGSVVRSGVATGRSASSNNTTVFASWGGGSQWFNGAIAEIVIVNRLATGSEASAIDAYASSYYSPSVLI